MCSSPARKNGAYSYALVGAGDGEEAMAIPFGGASGTQRGAHRRL